MYWKEIESELPVRHQKVYEGEGEIKRRRFFDGVSRLAVNIEKWELEPGYSEGNHTHDEAHLGEPLEEVYYFLKGSGVMYVDGEDVPVAAGEAVMVPPGSDHGFRNTGDGPLTLLLLWGRPTE